MNRFIIYLTILLSTESSLVRASRIPVEPGSKINSITQALGLARPGDTIIVKAGIYQEGNIKIDKPVVLIGQDKPVIDGENKVELFSISSSHVTISGFKLINSGVSSVKDLAGVGVFKADYITIKECEFVNTYFGVHFSDSHHSLIEDNRFEASMRNEYETGNGIHLWKCSNAAIRNNLIRYHRDGIYFEFVTQSVIERNRSEQNQRYGLHFMFSHDDEYHYNTFRENGAGVAVMYSRKVTMTHNRFEENWGNSAYGLLLKDISDSQVNQNRFTNNTVAVYMEGTSRTLFTKNSFSGNGWAVKLQASCDGNEFTGNNFKSNTFDFSTNGTLVLNRLNGNYWDKYQGYDLNKDGTGDVPYRPVNMYTMIVERIPTAVLLWRSFLVFLLDRAEKVFPAVTPENLKDDYPNMRPYDFDTTT